LVTPQEYELPASPFGLNYSYFDQIYLAAAKVGGIKLCESYNRQYGTDYRSVMPTNCMARVMS